MYHHISLGSNCCVSWHLRSHNMQSLSLPFDWCNMTINQLVDVLNNDFKDFEKLKIKKFSPNHPLIENNNTSNSGSYILENPYKIKFAHEITNETELINLSQSIMRRINRFRTILDNADKICFYRIELKNTNVNDVINLVKILENCVNWKLILIIPNNIEYQHNNVKIHYYDEFSPNWKMEHLDWKQIFEYWKSF